MKSRFLHFGLATAGTLLGALAGLVYNNAVSSHPHISQVDNEIVSMVVGAFIGIAFDLAINGVECRSWKVSLRVLMLGIAASAAVCFGLVNYWRLMNLY